MPGSTALEDMICMLLSRLYQDHASRTDRLTCKLEHALPIRHSFFRLKRVPHFQTRDDLHSEHTPAYIPLYRLENASLESLSQKSKAGCRRVLIEGDLGTGKTLVCQRLLHEWAKAMQFFRHVNVKGDHQRQEAQRTPNIKVAYESDIDKTKTSSRVTDVQKDYKSHQERSASQDKSVADSDGERCNKSRRTDDIIVGNGGEGRGRGIGGGGGGEGGASLQHRSRKTQFTEKQEQKQLSPSEEDEVPRSRSRRRKRKGSGKNNSSSRSRSAGGVEPDRTNTRRLRERARLICDGIPQKYLSLLNIGAPGEGAFESPSRTKSFRDSQRRKRPSRLTSNLTDYKAMIYIPCVRMALSDLLSRCNNSRVRHYFVAATVLLDLLTLSAVDLPYYTPPSFEIVYQWVLAHREDICVIFDNVDGSEAWERLINDAFHDAYGFGKIIAAATPGRLPKRDVDILFYCYGLSTEYSNKILLARLRSEAPDVIDRISFLLSSSHTQELLCNPLSLSLLTAYCRSVKPDDHVPEHLSELLEHLLHHAMSHEPQAMSTVSKASTTRGGGESGGTNQANAPCSTSTATSRRRNRFSLQSVCETVAFECLENDTNYFSKQKFPQQCWRRHLCDCRVLHEVHEVANFASIRARPPSPTRSSHALPLTPDSDSVHSSSASSILEGSNLQHTSELSSSNQSLASVATDQDGDANVGQINAQNTSASNHSVNSKDTSSRTLLLQVPSLHGSPSPASSENSSSSKKSGKAERPKSLMLSSNRSPLPTVNKPLQHQQQNVTSSSSAKSSAASSTAASTTHQTPMSQTGGDIVSFTSRCIRDYLASKRVCRYLQSDRDHESFVRRLIARPQFYPVLRLTVRTLYLLGRSDLVLNLLDMLMTSQELATSNQGPFGLAIPSPPRGPSPTHVTLPEPPHRVRIPHRYRLSHSDCAFRVKREDLKQRRSSTSILGTYLEGGMGGPGPTPSPSLNRLLLSSPALSNSLSPFSSPEPPENTKGYLEDFKESLIWLAETDNSEPYIGAVSARFPQTLVIPYQDCPTETIEHFICLTRRSQPSIQEAVLHMSGMYAQWDLGLRLARALRSLRALTLLRINMKCVVETSFLVEFLCDCFENNTHIETLHLEGPMNVAENLSVGEHKRVQAVFGPRGHQEHSQPSNEFDHPLGWNQRQSEEENRHPGGQPSIKLNSLVLEHFSYHHRVGYILASWPGTAALQRLSLRRCSVDGVAEQLKAKLSAYRDLTHLTLDNCFVKPPTLMAVLNHLCVNANYLRLTTLELTLLSAAKRFSKSDVKRQQFKPAITKDVCKLLAELIRVSPSLHHLLLSHNAITNERASVLLRAVPSSNSIMTLDLSGNLITNDVEDDIIFLLAKATGLTSLFLDDNSITKSTRSAIIRESLCRHDLKLSL